MTTTDKKPAEVEVITPPAVNADPGAMQQLLSAAIDKGVSVEALEKLVALHERVADRYAAQQFAEHLAAFQLACPPIEKKSTAKIATKAGGEFRYTYAELDEIARTVAPFLAARGFSYSWDSTTHEGTLAVVCTLRHSNGHSITSTFAAPVESRSGATSKMQDTASAMTYARRQSTVAILGLTTADPDNDGRKQEEQHPISEDQATLIRDLLSESGANVTRFLKWLGVESVAEIPLHAYPTAVANLEKARDKKAK